MDRIWKVLDGVTPTNGGTGRYPGTGRWTRHLDPDRLEACVYGFHLCRGPQLLGWLGPTVWEAEVCPDHPPVDAGGKVLTCRVRLVRRTPWDETTARLFAADCAEAALLGERASGREPNGRSWDAVGVVRRFALGEATAGELATAADAAWAAADAAWAAARADARAAYAAATAARAAAARADAAGAAARAAARADARAALGTRLVAYLDGVDPGPVTPLYGEEAV